MERDIAQSFMVASVVIVFDEGSNRFFQLTRYPKGHSVDSPLKGAVVPLNLAIGLRMEGRGGNVPYPHQSQIFIELLRNVSCPVIRQQHCPVLQRHIGHAGKV